MSKHDTTEQIAHGEHGLCSVIEEHGQEWLACNRCGAQWSLNGSELELVSDGDGFCEEYPCDESEPSY